ncbi:hypothetical protein PsorP6_003107 [Peronosclerospora sorghi]|uniref:Uncharacterized protein n=1 Tax=Peronosclerospora sorghi TaxID=230839 RepID=A0ACC0VKX9_9STRA|nr:hypothetical protein PsorP6_003107 [Peronosclerospora sorghi]
MNVGFIITAITIDMGRKRAGGRRMRREDGDGDETASVASIETRETIMSDGGDFYDGYSNNLDDEQQIDEAIENLTEERNVQN